MNTKKSLLPLYEPPEFDPESDYDLDAYIPANDTLAITKRNILREVRAATINLSPRFVSAVTSVIMAGESYTSASRRYRMSSQALSNCIRNTKYGNALAQALNRLKSLDEGTKYEQREAMLWRIAVDNEKADPRTTISALAEINRSKADTPDAIIKKKENDTLTNQPQVIIQLQDARLTASPLDELPNSMRDIN